jgi:NAD(P)-dependent dehydrogenase (short-subunit alcohol dehydrogenase family)
MKRLCEGRVAIVTGGGRGIGREYCHLLAAHGAKVVVNDLGGSPNGEGNDIGPAEQVVEEIKSKGGEAIAHGGDVSNWKSAKEMIDTAISTFGKLDVLINNAGILRDRMLVNMTEDDWDLVIKVHLKGTYALSHHAANHWRTRSKEIGGLVYGRLINTSSPVGLYVMNSGQSNYGAAKAGIAAFTMIAARELERYGVTVNAIAPGAATRLTEGLIGPTAELREKVHPRWIAPVAVWLASERSQGITGQVFDVMGDTIAVTEGWRRGPSVQQSGDPDGLEQLLADLTARARASSWASS